MLNYLFIIFQNFLILFRFYKKTYDPYEVYNQRKRAIIDAIAKPKFLHDNARREQEAAVRRAKGNNIAAMAGTAGIGVPALAALHNYANNRPHSLGEYGALALGDLGSKFPDDSNARL